jgi:hypothetical protein
MVRRRRWNYLRCYATATVGCLLAVTAANWLIDPLHFYHRPFLHHTFIDNQRSQNPGLAKNYDYDAVIIGSSHTENFSPRQIESVLGWQALPLSISGSTAREQRLILEKSLGTGRVRHVLSRDTLDFSRRALVGKGPRDLETLHAWSQKFVFSEDRVIAAWRQECAARDRKVRKIGASLRRPAREALFENVQTNLAAIVKSHPDVTFHLFFPPYSILMYVDDFAIAEDRFAQRLEFKAEIVRSLERSGNCRLYDFETAFEVTHDLNNYKDLSHYDRRINDFIVESIARDEYRLDAANCAARLAEFENSVRGFVRQAMTPESPWHAQLELDKSPLHFRESAPHRLAQEQERAVNR